MMTVLRALVLALSLLLSGTVAATAQTAAAPPAGMTQEQFDSLVEAISKSVAEKLKADAKPAAEKPKPGKNAAAPVHKTASPAHKTRGEFVVFLEKAGQVLRSSPELGRQIATVVGASGSEAGSGPGFFNVVLILVAAGTAAVLAEAGLRRILGGVRARLATGSGAEAGLRSLLHLAALLALDGLGLLVVWLICNGANAWFSGGTAQDRFVEAALMGIFTWRLYMLVFRFLLQPDAPRARLCAVTDDNVGEMYRALTVVMFLFVAGRTLATLLVASGATVEVIAAYQVAVVAIYVSVFLWLVFHIRTAARQWLEGLSVLAPLAGVIGRHWVGAAGTFFAILGATQLYSAVSGRVQVGNAMLLTLAMVAGLLFFETLMQAFVRRLDSQLVGRTPAGNGPKLPDVVARCLRVAILIGAAVTIAQSWVVDVFGLASADRWDEITRSSRTAAVTLFLAYVLWELFKYLTEPYMARKPKNAAEAIADGDANAAPASRISTMMPLLRMAGAILILFLAVMISLEDFGINVMPLLAGASIFGIAISFGSQTLVRDIVSGIFYLSDDAFRVGEYIDCGRAKGTVEGFTLRSIKLRHQNGQVHTIPFGQLGQITNFSRDWITVKFNLRFARDTDIEKLRKAAKKIGQDMLAVPEIKAEILAPFKMQGVADIVDNALLVRFKFTTRPGNPAMIQREAVKRLFNTLPGLGIEFAKEGAAVILQTATAAGEERPAPDAAARPAAGNLATAAAAG